MAKPSYFLGIPTNFGPAAAIWLLAEHPPDTGSKAAWWKSGQGQLF